MYVKSYKFGNLNTTRTDLQENLNHVIKVIRVVILTGFIFLVLMHFILLIMLFDLNCSNYYEFYGFACYFFKNLKLRK